MLYKTFLELILKTFISEKYKIPIITNYSEIYDFLTLTNSRKYEYLYHNKTSIHKILYDNEKIINILSNNTEYNIANLFYLTLLIKDQPCLTNYIYDFDYINNVNNFRKDKNDKLTCFILSMIIIELIDNYRNAEDFYEEIHEDKLRKMYEENKKIRDNFINSNNNFDLNKKEVTLNNIEEIYSKILISLITKEKFKNYELSKDILNQLGFENINITENMFQNLFILFNNNNNIGQKYAISKLEDLYDEQKIGFYYLIFKYIFKNNIYIYKIAFLLKSRNIIIKLIKFETDNILKFNKNNNKKNNKLKNEFVIKTFCDSNYYFIKYLGEKYEQLKEILKYYQDFLFESKKNEIENLTTFLKYLKTEINYEPYLEDFEKAKKLNERNPIIKYLLQEEKVNYINETIMNEYIIKWDELEKIINDKKLKKMKKNHKKILTKYFNDNNNKDILLKIFKEEIYEYFINETKRLIIDEEKNNELSKNISDFEIEEKVYNSTDSSTNKKTKNENDKIKGNESIIKAKIDDSNYSECKKDKNNKIIDNCNCTIVYNSEIQNEVSFYDESDYELLSYDRVIGTHKGFANFITELKNGYFVSGGDKRLLIYSQNYYQVMEINNKKVISSICEIKNTQNTERSRNEIELIICSKEQIGLIALNTIKNDYKTRKYTLTNLSTSVCLEVKRNNHILLGENRVYLASDLFSKIIATKIDKIFEGTYKGIIKISKNIYALSSNKILKHGEDNLIFFNSNCGKVFKIIKGYSFISSSNGLFLMSKEEDNNKILLCACKKYKSNQNNGILLVNSKFEEINLDVKKTTFYNTGNFEVYCFCPISKKKKTDYIKIFTDDDDLEETDYFLVGGFDKYKGKGIIKLYKLIRNENVENTKIEFIQDIDIKKTKQFNGFKSPITCITQSKKYLKILVSCLDGKIHLLSAPNIDIFLKYDEKTKYDLKIALMEKRRKEIIVGVE